LFCFGAFFLVCFVLFCFFVVNLLGEFLGILYLIFAPEPQHKLKNPKYSGLGGSNGLAKVRKRKTKSQT